MHGIYVRYLRGTALGNAVRRLWYWDWRDALRAAASAKYPGLPNVRARWGELYQRGHLFRYRVSYVAQYYWTRIQPAFLWLVESRETSNFTYDLTGRNEEYLAHMLSVILGRPQSEIAGYIRELHDDCALKEAMLGRVKELGRNRGLDTTARFGRRVGWYAVARTMKPAIIIETGVEKGLGAVVLCAALLRNAEEGHSGRYYGTDIDLAAGMLLIKPYSEMGSVVYGDSISSLEGLDVEVDLFISDSDHSASYERREYQTIARKLSERAIILGDNAHVTDELMKFSRDTGRHFLFFREEPANHWYLGAGIGLSFK